ncbi:MAG: glycosyltransferase family 2 protein [Thermodesulfobacteriota bacterium]
MTKLENEPLVSVIIPVYNGVRYLADAIESVLAQTYRPAEVIVVDDGSTDGSANIAKVYTSVRYYFQPNKGVGAARNSGVDLARGAFFAFLDADDIWIKDKLYSQMETFNADTTLDMVFGQVEQFLSPELDENKKSTTNYSGEIIPGYIAGTLLIKRESFFRAGYFATNWRVGEFIDWYTKAIEQGLKSCTIPGVVMKRRIHNDNTVLRERNSRTDYVRILKASLDRRRKGKVT